jgi:hypothetical protein
MRPRLVLFAVLLLAPLAASGEALAQPAQPLDRLLPEIRRSMPGQFLDAEPGNSDSGSPRYRLKWLTPEGRVIWRDVDARTGRVMGNREVFGRQRQEPRPNFRNPGSEDEDGAARFGNRFGPRPDFGGEDRAAPREFNRERFNRPPFGDGNGPNFGSRRFGGDNGRGAGNRSFGGGRGRGRGGND